MLLSITGKSSSLRNQSVHGLALPHTKMIITQFHVTILNVVTFFLLKTFFILFVGELIKIVIEDYVQHISNYNFKLMFRPEIVHWQQHRYTYATPVEFAHMYHWHPLMPETFNISGTNYEFKDYVYHSELVVKHGMRAFVDALSRQIAGKVEEKSYTTYFFLLFMLYNGIIFILAKNLKFYLFIRF